MDLLDSILGSMDKPPSLSENEKKAAKELKVRIEEEEEEKRKWRNKYKRKIEGTLGKFLEDYKLKRLKLPEPIGKLERSIVYEVCETAGVISHSFEIEEEKELKNMILFKKEYPPSENELKALRNGKEYDPSKVGDTAADEGTGSNDREQPQAPQGDKYGIPFNYQEKYRKMLGDLDCTGKSAIKMEPNKAFGYVPSANKRDLRSIEQTLNDMKSRKKPRLDNETLLEDKPSSAT